MKIYPYEWCKSFLVPVFKGRTPDDPNKALKIQTNRRKTEKIKNTIILIVGENSTKLLAELINQAKDSTSLEDRCNQQLLRNE